MLDFIYDSLDTVKKLKFPTLKQVAQLTLGIFALVILAGAYFVLVDTLASGGYKAFYTAMTGKEITPVHQAVTDAQPTLDLSGLNMVLSGAEANAESPGVELPSEESQASSGEVVQ